MVRWGRQSPASTALSHPFVSLVMGTRKRGQQERGQDPFKQEVRVGGEDESGGNAPADGGCGGGECLGSRAAPAILKTPSDLWPLRSACKSPPRSQISSAYFQASSYLSSPQLIVGAAIGGPSC